MDRPIRVLELTWADGEGGGPDKTILLGASRTDRGRFAITVCYVHDCRRPLGIADRAAALGIDFVAIGERRRADLQAWRTVRRLVRDRQIDIVHAHGYKADLAALMLARTEAILPLSTAHGFSGHSWRERAVYYPLDRWLLARYPSVIAVSSQLRDAIVGSGADPRRVHTILNGIDPQTFRREPHRREQCRASLGIAPGEIAIGGIGRVEREKRFDVLLTAFAALLARRRNLRLLIAGDGSLLVELQAMAHELGVSHACRFLGNRRDIGQVYQALDVVVQSSDCEGTANVVLEAMALEVPVVATDVGGTAELITDGVHGLLVPPRNPDLLGRAILRALDEPAFTGQRIAAARVRVEHELSFEARMRAVEQIYERLMAARNRC